MIKKVSELVRGDRILVATERGTRMGGVVERAFKTHSTPAVTREGIKGVAWIVTFTFPKARDPLRVHHIFVHPDEPVRVDQ